jgi:hypothetical protein
MVLTNDDSENDMMMDDVHDNSDGRTEMNLSGAGSSRILQSASLQKQEQMEVSGEGDQPHFPELSAVQASGNKIEYRRVRCPPHRYTPLRESWEQILTPLVEYLKLQVCTALYRDSVLFCWTEFWCEKTESRRLALYTCIHTNIEEQYSQHGARDDFDPNK